MVWATRLTANQEYIDDIMWTTVGAGGNNSCTVTARSRSQSLSWYDFSVNFCNMYNPLRGAKLFNGTLEEVQVSRCQFPPTNITKCDRY